MPRAQAVVAVHSDYTCFGHAATTVCVRVLEHLDAGFTVLGQPGPAQLNPPLQVSPQVVDLTGSSDEEDASYEDAFHYTEVAASDAFQGASVISQDINLTGWSEDDAFDPPHLRFGTTS